MEVDDQTNSIAENQRETKILLNKREDIEPYHLNFEDRVGLKGKFSILFARYKKLFLVQYKSLKPNKNLKDKDFQQIVKYI